MNDVTELVAEMNHAFWVIPGDPESCVVIHVPRSSWVFPEDVADDLMLDGAALERELVAMTDDHFDLVDRALVPIGESRAALLVESDHTSEVRS
jgi:hypothetical protein